jgi:predicted nucleic acid-binding protein
LSRCYLDTNFLYAHLRSTPAKAPQALRDWVGRVLAQAADDGAVISALVQDELAYRLILAWLREDGINDPLSSYRADARATMQTVRARLTASWRALDSLELDLQPTDRGVVEHARALMARPGIPPRDAFHAAHALAAGCDAIASTDSVFDEIKGLHRLGP